MDFTLPGIVGFPPEQVVASRAAEEHLLCDVAPECLIAVQEGLREVKHRLPKLTLDARRTVAVLEVLNGERSAQGLGMRIDVRRRRPIVCT